MKTLNQIPWCLTTLTLTVTMGMAPCWAAEPSAGGAPPASAAKPAPKPVAEKLADVRQAVDLRPAFQQWGLSPRLQGGRGTCSVFALTAAIEYAVASKQQKGTRLSVEFLNWAANERAHESSDGGTFSKLWRGCAAYGICPEAEMPYAASFNPAAKPDKKAIGDAEKMRALGLRIHWIKRWDSSRGASDAQLAEIKRTLERGWPVSGGFLWPNGGKDQWKNHALQVCPRSDVFDGHSVLLVGFRDDKTQGGGGAFLIRNSAGGRRNSMLSYGYVQAYMNDAVWIDFRGASEGGPRRSAAPDSAFNSLPSKPGP